MEPSSPTYSQVVEDTQIYTLSKEDFKINKDYLKQVRLYGTFYEKNKHLLETGERNIQALRKHFSE